MGVKTRILVLSLALDPSLTITIRVPLECTFNGGKVPPGFILNGGTVPPGCISYRGTVPPGFILNKGIPPFKGYTTFGE